MRATNPVIVAMVLIVGLFAQSGAQAQSPGAARAATAGGFANYPGAGSNFDYYSLSTGFGNYGLPGTYPNYAGNALSGYGPGAPVGAYFATPKAPKPANVYNNTGGVMDSIKQQAGKSVGYPYGTTRGVSRPRRPR